MIGRTTPEARKLDELLTRMSVLTVWIVGLVVVFFPVLPGWEAIKSVGEGKGELHFLRVLIGFLLLYIGAMIRERQRLKSGLMDLMESFDSFNAAIYGKNYKVTRETVTYLITSLASANLPVRQRAHAILVKMTGVDLGAEHGPWKKWWDKHKLSFQVPDSGGEGEVSAGKEESDS